MEVKYAFRECYCRLGFALVQLRRWTQARLTFG